MKVTILSDDARDEERIIVNRGKDDVRVFLVEFNKLFTFFNARTLGQVHAISYHRTIAYAGGHLVHLYDGIIGRATSWARLAAKKGSGLTPTLVSYLRC
jgi:hypothetical protein